MKTLKLSDDRYLAYDEYGDPDGTPVIFNHGLADSRLIRNPDDALTASLGVRVIAADQPGVGGSSPQPCRRMVDWGKDMEELADALGLGRFNVAGHSGGAPHALAIPYRLPDRVGRVVLASPVAPHDEPRMGKLMIKGDTLPSDPALREMFEASFTAGMSPGGERLFDAAMALWDWGFRPEDVNQPVDLFYGDADDMLDPRMSQHLGARLPDCTIHVWSGAGHYGFVDRARWTDFLTAVA